jgi:hypothetical protein
VLLDFLFPQPSQIRSERSASPPIAQPDVVSPSLYSFQVPNDCTFHPILLQPVPPANQCHSTSARDAFSHIRLPFSSVKNHTRSIPTSIYIYIFLFFKTNTSKSFDPRLQNASSFDTSPPPRRPHPPLALALAIGPSMFRRILHRNHLQVA